MGELYHGSSESSIKRLEPRKSKHGDFDSDIPFIYATPYKELSIIFSGRCGDDYTFSLSRLNDSQPWQLVERIPRAFETMFRNGSSIYTVDDTTFHDIHSGFAELVSEVGVDVKKEEKVANVYDEIKKLQEMGKVQIYEYPNRPKEIPLDNSDLLEKEISQAKLRKQAITKNNFERLLFLHPQLVDKVNQELLKSTGGVEFFSKQDLVDNFEKFVLRQLAHPEKEQYLSSAVISYSTVFPELMPYIQEKVSIIDKSKEEQHERMEIVFGNNSLNNSQSISQNKAHVLVRKNPQHSSGTSGFINMAMLIFLSIMIVQLSVSIGYVLYNFGMKG